VDRQARDNTRPDSIHVPEEVGTLEGIRQTVAILFALTGVLAYLAPAESTLGSAYKLIYLHLPLMYVSFLSLILALLFSLASLGRGRDRFYRRAYNAAFLGLVFGAGTLATTAVFMTMAWGGIAFSEPRFRVLLLTYGLFLVYLALHRLKRKELTALYATAASLMAASAYYLLVTGGSFQLHPEGVAMPLKMRLPFYPSMAGFLVLYYHLMELMEKR